MPKKAGHWLGEADFQHRPFQPLVERSSRSNGPPYWDIEFRRVYFFDVIVYLINRDKCPSRNGTSAHRR
jgi:hypothetical protein